MKKTKVGLFAALAGSALVLSACGGGGIVSDGGGQGGGATSDSTATGDASGESVELNMVTMVQPHTPNAPVQNWFLDQIEERSNGRIKVNRTEPDSICKPAEVAECVRDGRADIGTSISDYPPQLFPTMSVATLPFMADNSQAFMEAIYKANTENEDAKAAWDDSGIKLIAAWHPGLTIIGTNGKVSSIEDIKGKRFRVTGAYLQQAFEKVGANVVALPANETYEGVERGLADAVSWTMDGPVDYKLMEQLKDWALPGAGVYTTFAIWLNSEKFEAMPDDLKKVVEDVQADLIAGEGMKAFNEATEAQCDAMLEYSGVESFTAWDESATAEWKDQVLDDLLAAWQQQAASDGLANPEKFLADYRAAYDEAAAKPDIVEDPVKKCIERFANR